MSAETVIIDYGMGNLGSVANAFAFLGADVKLTSSPDDVMAAQRVVLPGVGAFGDCMKHLKRLNLDRAIRDYVADDRPFLGICLGLQVLFEYGEESGGARGLGIFPGRVVRFAPREQGGPLKVPHMGWNQLSIKRELPILDGIEALSFVYFVHSYYVQPSDQALVATTTDYDCAFVSSIARGNLFAAQFHPEKSQDVGLKMLKNFTELS